MGCSHWKYVSSYKFTKFPNSQLASNGVVQMFMVQKNTFKEQLCNLNATTVNSSFTPWLKLMSCFSMFFLKSSTLLWFLWCYRVTVQLFSTPTSGAACEARNQIGIKSTTPWCTQFFLRLSRTMFSLQGSSQPQSILSDYWLPENHFVKKHLARRTCEIPNTLPKTNTLHVKIGFPRRKGWLSFATRAFSCKFFWLIFQLLKFSVFQRRQVPEARLKYLNSWLAVWSLILHLNC